MPLTANPRFQAFQVIGAAKDILIFMKRNPSCLSALMLAFLMCGCARFSTTQLDERIYADGEKTTIRTKASSWTFLESKSSLSTWEAVQSENSQSAHVGGLSQESSATNTVQLIESAVGAAVKAAIPIP